MLPAFKFESVLAKKLIVLFLRKGLRLKINKIINKVFFLLMLKTGYTFSYLSFILFFKLNAFVEVRNVITKRRTHVVPFALHLRRRYFLIAQWIFCAIKLNKKKISLVEKIYDEFFTICVQSKMSGAYLLKQANFKKATENRANVHYRW